MMRRLILPALLLLVSARAAPAAVYEYAYDDGRASNLIGPAYSGQMLWGNYFFAEENADVLVGVRVVWGRYGENRPAQVLIFDDPDDDGNPGNARLLARTPVVSGPSSQTDFVDYVIPPTLVSGGFFVAVLADIVFDRDNVAVADRPGRLDRDTPVGRSWLAGDGVIDVDNLSDSFQWFNMNQVFPGSWMIRATAVPEPAAGATLGLAGWMLLARRRGRA